MAGHWSLVRRRAQYPSDILAGGVLGITVTLALWELWPPQQPPAILGTGALIALFVVGLVTALSREELRPPLGTLDAVGAAPRTRRGFAAAQSGLLAGMAALLAVPAGLVPAVTLLRAQSRDVAEVVNGVSTLSEGAVPVVIPWLAIAALVVGVTVLSTLGGGLFTRAQERRTA